MYTICKMALQWKSYLMVKSVFPYLANIKVLISAWLLNTSICIDAI